VKALIAAILWVAPYVGPPRAESYAQLIHAEATRGGIDPLLIVALVYKESRFRPGSYKARNYGLMQVRVSASVNPDLIGREKLLFNPRFNIKRGMRMARMWKRYHERTCGDDSGHPWNSHYQWGRKVGDPGSGERVRALYRKLVERFRGGDQAHSNR